MSLMWLNGELVALDAARISPMDRGFTLGDGLFETMRVRAGWVMNLYAHMARLVEGGRVLGLPVPDTAAVRQALCELLDATDLEEGSIRLTLSRGEGPRGLQPPANGRPTLVLTASPGAFARTTVRAITSKLIRRDETSPLSRIKSLNYLPGILARQEAARASAEEALLLNMQGRVAESTISTIIVASEDGELTTPPVSEGALPGVARGVLLARGLVREATLENEQILWARGVWLVNTLSLREVTVLDGQALATDLTLTETLATCFDTVPDAWS
ncbi:MAG: aminotransferase class IV [Acetobacter papayae]|uniref:aminotransferase class IV n=1 Tax=Acetobacter papayae TaxID=1076592 RepID=UPI0039ECCEF3